MKNRPSEVKARLPFDYSDSELEDLKTYYRKQHQPKVTSHKANNLRAQAKLGFFATTLESAFINWAQWSGMSHYCGGPHNRAKMDGAEINEWWQAREVLKLIPKVDSVHQLQMRTRVAFHVAWALRDYDADFFERIAIILRAQKAERPLKRISAKTLLSKRRKGRGLPAHSLECCFPSAITSVVISRLNDFGDGINKARITRQELLKAIQFEQKCAGLDNPPIISQSELSRWIADSDFQRFMAEQPITKPKSAKVKNELKVHKLLNSSGVAWCDLCELLKQNEIIHNELETIEDAPQEVTQTIIDGWKLILKAMKRKPSQPLR